MNLRIFGLLVLAIAVGAPDQSRAANLTALVSFNGTNGANPYAGLITDANGNLFGTTETGGASTVCTLPSLPVGCGTVFEIVKTAAGYTSTPTTLVSFNGTNGSIPDGGLIADATGDLFGTTAQGGPNDVGTVFEIVKTATGYASTPTTLVNFNAFNGSVPLGSLITDASGNLFGTTETGGASTACLPVVGCGTVFEIVKTATGYASTPTTLVNFNGTDGQYPESSLIADANGNLFGTTDTGGASTACSTLPLTAVVGCGTVFEIAKTAAGYAGTPTTLVSFNGTNGAALLGSLITDANGNLFGTTFTGGASTACTYFGVVGCGTVFEIVKTAAGYASTPTPLISFNGTNGSFPFAGLIADAAGNLYGTTFSGGAHGDGTVFEVAKTATGYASTPTILASFDGTNGADPTGSLSVDASGNLFGTTFSGGANGDGTVFEITGSGFVIPVLIPASEVAAAATGLAYSRVSRTFNGTLTITNISGSPISGPFSILFTALTAGVSLANATGTFSGSPYLAVPGVTGLAAGQSATIGVQFNDPSFGTINFTPVVYSGSI